MVRNFILLPIAILLLIIAYSYDKINTVSLNQYVKKIESKIHKYEKEIVSVFEDKALIEKAINHDFEENEIGQLRKLSNNNYAIYIYKNPDSLVFWTSNKVLPFESEIQYLEEPTSGFSRIQSGGYSTIIYPYKNGKEEYVLIGLIPVFYEYSIQNEFLVNGFSIVDNIPSAVTVQFEPTEYEVYNSSNKSLFYLTSTESFIDKGQQYFILILYLLGLITLFWFLNDIALHLTKTQEPWIGVVFSIVTVVLVRVLTVQLNFDSKFDDIYIFSTKYFSDQSIVSLGNLLVNAIIGLWLMMFFYREFKLPKKLIENKEQHFYYYIGIVSLILSGVLISTETFRRLIFYSNDNFDINNLYSLSTFPLVGTLTLSLILLSLFLFIVKLKFIARKLTIDSNHRWIIKAVIAVLFLILYFTKVIDFALFFSGLFTIAVIGVMHNFVRQKTAGFLWLVGWICAFGAFSSVLFYEFNYLKEINSRVFYAENIAFERDVYTEEVFDNVAANIKKDHFIKKISSLFIPRARIVNQIKDAYLEKNFSNKYDYFVNLYTADSIGTKDEDLEFAYFEKLLSTAKKTSNPYLYYSNSGGQQRYIANLPILADNRKYYQVIITLVPKTIEKLSEYPKLLLDKSFDLQKKYEEYSYGIYNKGKKLTSNKGRYSEKLTFKIPERNNTIVRKNNTSYLIHKINDDKIVIIGKEISGIGSAFSLFSFTFCFFLVLFSLLLTINRLAEKLPIGSFLDLRVPPSLRNKIQNNVVAIVVLAFVGIGVTTVIYFRAESQEYHAGRLSRKAKAVNKTAKYDITANQDSLSLPDFEALSNIHNLDVNLYDRNGIIQNSSQPSIFEKDLLSERMNPIAFHNIKNLKRGIEYEDEIIGNLEYRTAYMSVKRDEEIIGFIGLPYYTEKENSRKDIGTFMGRLLNVYVLIFIFAGIVTYILTGQITNPLDKLSRQMRNVKLGQRNEALSWGTEDEIGGLIEQYNKMLEELERSANLLAKSEREGAWREMAKQVAHEIKNPLTPMKLQIQFLQRAYKSRPEDVGPLLKRTAYTLIEQIDGLTRIASDFSNFAKMPVANSEHLMLNTIVQSVFELFSKEENVKLSVTITKQDCPIYADKDQVVRVLNNIIKNAIQAITFAVDYDREGRVDILLERKGNIALVSIEDNGTGIPEDKINKVFVPNFTTKNSGTGLGLAMSKNIVEAAGGKIYFDTTFDVGTTFYVEIPITEKE